MSRVVGLMETVAALVTKDSVLAGFGATDRTQEIFEPQPALGTECRGLRHGSVAFRGRELLGLARGS